MAKEKMYAIWSKSTGGLRGICADKEELELFKKQRKDPDMYYYKKITNKNLLKEIKEDDVMVNVINGYVLLEDEYKYFMEMLEQVSVEIMTSTTHMIKLMEYLNIDKEDFEIVAEFLVEISTQMCEYDDYRFNDDYMPMDMEDEAEFKFFNMNHLIKTCIGIFEGKVY